MNIKKRKALALTFAVVMAITSLAGCGSKDESEADSSSGAKTNTKSVEQQDMDNNYNNAKKGNQGDVENAPDADTQGINSVGDFVNTIGIIILIEDIKSLDVYLIGADEGKSFTYEENTFEIYYFSDEEKLSEAETGTLKYDVEGTGEVSAKTVVNGNYVLLFDEEMSDDDSKAVVNAFKNLKANN